MWIGSPSHPSVLHNLISLLFPPPHFLSAPSQTRSSFMSSLPRDILNQRNINSTRRVVELHEQQGPDNSRFLVDRETGVG